MLPAPRRPTPSDLFACFTKSAQVLLAPSFVRINLKKIVSSPSNISASTFRQNARTSSLRSWSD